MKLRMALIHCGQTEDGARGCFVGKADQPLSPSGREELLQYREEGIYPQVPLVYADSLSRCVETAAIIYPGVPALVSAGGLAPFDYGAFTGKTTAQLEMDKRFQQWLESEYVEPCPGGDHPYTFQAKCARTFKSVAEEMASKGIEASALVTHQSVISTLMQRFILPRSAYKRWDSAWGRGYLVEYDTRQSAAKLLSSI